MNDIKEQIITLFGEIGRPGTDRVLTYLCESTYFTARCHSHHRFRGGLAMHSLGVYREMKAMNTGLSDESIRIVALLHDLCTSHHPDYDHIGRHHHGLRSVALIDELGFPLTEEERLAIGKHMHRVHRKKPGHSFNKKDQLWFSLNKCDHLNAEKEGKMLVTSCNINNVIITIYKKMYN